MFADLLNKGLPFILLPIITRYIAPAEYGYIANLNSFIAISFLFVRIGSDGFVSVKFLRNEFSNLYHLIIDIAWNSLLGFGTLVVFLFVSDSIYPLDEFVPGNWLFIGLFACFLNVFTQIRLVLFQAREQPKYFGLNNFFITSINFLLSYILVVNLGMGWQGRAIGITSAWIIPGAISLILILAKGAKGFRANRSIRKEAREFGLPLILHHLNDWLKKGADVLLLSGMIGTASAGIYSISFQLSMIIHIVAYALLRTLNPKFYKVLNKLENEKDQVLDTLMKWTIYFLGIIVGMALLAIVCIPLFFEIFFSEDYSQSIELIPILTISYTFASFYLIFTPYFFYFKKTRMLSQITLVTGGIHVMMSFLLIQQYGMMGSVYASLASQFITLSLTVYFSNKLFPLPWLKFMASIKKK